MKTIKLIFVVMISVGILSCGNKKTETTNNTKTTENKEQNQTSGTATKTETQVAVIKAVENSSSKNIAPIFSWTENGTEKSTKDLKGKVLFVNFWATWCAPCKKEMPDLSSISEELKDKDFKMIGLCVAEGNEISKINDILKAIPVSYVIIQGNDKIVSAFKDASGNDMQAVPTSFIINKDGKIVETIVGSKTKKFLEDKINEYLN
jgi:thiol-disulfide isomerase/thioredoxin